MKLFFVVLAVAMISLHAEDLIQTDGTVYKDITITKVEPDGITIIHSGGAGKISFEKLSPELQQKYGYDPAKAEAYAKAKQAQIDQSMAAQEKAKADQQTAQAKAREKVAQAKDANQKSLADEQATRSSREQLEAGKAMILGKVISKTKDGLVVICKEPKVSSYPGSSIGPRLANTVEYDPNAGLRAKRVYGTFFLKNHPDQATLTDDDQVKILAYLDGQYSYTSVDGAAPTIKAYTAQLP